VIDVVAREGLRRVGQLLLSVAAEPRVPVGAVLACLALCLATLGLLRAELLCGRHVVEEGRHA
jgi:hypothetical protein